MKEIGQSPTLQEISFSPYHHQFGASLLETLPEEDGDTGEECDTFGSRSTSPGTPDCFWSTPNSGELVEGDLKIQPTIRHEIERQRAKVLLLEATIGQLQEELRESKDQNELLEFRLLELGHLDSSSSQQTIRVNSREVDRCNRRKSLDSENSEEGVEGLESPSSQGTSSLYEAEVSSREVTNNEEGANGHAHVAEARSSCSDCSESLSFQESGIFESQLSDDSYHSRSIGGQSQDDMRKELGHLLCQLEDLIYRFHGDELRNPESTETFQGSNTRGKSQPQSEHELSYEFLLFRQQIQEFELKLRKNGDVDYIQSLENKIALLLSESRKLEEEKAEMEEAENDSRNMCQRFEEKLRRSKQQKRELESEVSAERDFIQQLKTELQNFEDNEQELLNRISSLEAKLQIQEQQNFDLEELTLELKDSIQFLLQLIPMLIAWVFWKFQRQHRANIKKSEPTSANNVKYSIQQTSLLKNKMCQNILLGLKNIPPLSPFFIAPNPPLPQIQQEISRLPKGLPISQRFTPEFCRFLPIATPEAENQPEVSMLPLSFPESETLPEELPVSMQDLPNVARELPNFERNAIGVQTCPELLEGAQEKSCESGNIPTCDNELLSRRKWATLEVEWEALIKALDEFEAERIGKNCNELVARPRPVPPPKLKGTLVANRIRSLFPTEMTSNESSTEDFPKHNNARLLKINNLQNSLQQKVNEILAQKIPVTHCDALQPNTTENVERENGNLEIVHLKAENNRLRGLLHEEETNWSRIATLEHDNAQLREALTTAVDLRAKLDVSRSYAQRMMNRVEELEQSDMAWKEKFRIEEKKEKINLERILGLRTERELLASKVALLQDELQVKEEAEAFRKQEDQILQAKYQEALFQLQDIESTHNRLEADFQEQRTLAEVTERADESEKRVQILNSKLDELEKINMELKKQMAEVGLSSPKTQSNGLEAFAKKEGGLKGVCWHVKDAMTNIENCALCKLTAGQKLREVSEQLNTLTHVLEGSQAEGRLSSLSLSRCESEEHLFPSLMGSNLTKWNSSGTFPWRSQHEENKALKRSVELLQSQLLKKEEDLQKLSERHKIQSTQLKGLDEIRLRREKDLRESHLNESWWWKLRCDEKNELIQILARRIVQLSASEINGGGFVLDTILREIGKVCQSYPVNTFGPAGGAGEEAPLDTTSLLQYFQVERTRIIDMLQTSAEPLTTFSHSNLDFRVLRRVGEDALLVSWCAKSALEEYEITVNGQHYLCGPCESRCRVLLFDLDMSEPIQICLKLDGVKGQDGNHKEAAITYIA